MAGIKDERGKSRVSLIDMSYVMGIIETFEHGAETYELNNWLQLKPETLYNAMFRHLAAMAMGEYYDSKSGLPHLFHVGANAMMIYTLTKKEGKFESNFDLFKTKPEEKEDSKYTLQGYLNECYRLQKIEKWQA